MVKHTQTIRLSVFDHFVGLALKGLSNTLTQPYFDDPCSAWNPGFFRNAKSQYKILTSQNKCLHFSL